MINSIIPYQVLEFQGKVSQLTTEQNELGRTKAELKRTKAELDDTKSNLEVTKQQVRKYRQFKWYILFTLWFLKY